MYNKNMSEENFDVYDDEGKTIDYLEEDTEIPTQRYGIVSFISPEKVIKQKNAFVNEKFIQWLDYDWKVKGMEKLMDFLSKKYSIKIDDLLKDMQEFSKIHNDDIKKTDIMEQYQVFLLKNEKDLDTEFTEKVKFRTNVRGVKIRRVFANLEEAQMFCKVLQRKYPRDNLYLGKVGCWLPWDPSEHIMPDVEYAEKELNELMRKYKENEVNKDIFFEERKKEKMEEQKKENAKRKQALADKGEVDLSEIRKVLEDSPVHPAEGGIRV